ncbi:hypothetical protein WA158_003375 [Blastocystis sp. Blastoise]
MITASFNIFSLPIYVRQYIGQAEKEYNEDTNNKHSLCDLIPGFKNGRTMKCKEYKHFIDSLKLLKHNVPYVIESIEKQQEALNVKHAKCLSELCLCMFYKYIVSYYIGNSSLENRINEMKTNKNVIPTSDIIIYCNQTGDIYVQTYDFSFLLINTNNIQISTNGNTVEEISQINNNDSIEDVLSDNDVSNMRSIVSQPITESITNYFGTLVYYNN